LVAGDLSAGAASGNLTVAATTGSNVISTGSGNDLIAGGAGVDTLDGDTGINTYSAAGTVGITEAGSTGASAGQVINLSGGTLTATAIKAAMGNLYITADNLLDVTTNTASYLFATADISINNSTVTDTLANFVNATGSSGVDYIVGSAGVNTIAGGLGADVIVGNAGADILSGDNGADTFVYASGATGQTLVGADTITDFVTANDFISTGAINFLPGNDVVIKNGVLLANFAAFVAAAEAEAFDSGLDVYVAYNVANISAGNALVAIDTNDDGLFNAGDSLIVLTGINASGEIAVANFIA
jgi:Ca2+-binding RTX toxin-like protein